MQYVSLGRTGLRVSRLCFGTLTMGPLQANLSLAEGCAVLRCAFDLGVNFVDTAEIYGTYPYIRQALKWTSRPVIVATKSYAYTREGMKKSLEQALADLDFEQIGLFLLHEQESALTLRGHYPALEYLLEAKAAGKVYGVGVSTHSVDAVRAAALMPEIDVIHPLINIKGIGIQGGKLDDMVSAVSQARLAGKGIYAMKAIGGGNLIHSAEKALRYAFSLPFVDAVAVGMQTNAEVEMNVALSEGQNIPLETAGRIKLSPRRLHIEDWCAGCGACISRCPQGALVLAKGRAKVLEKDCLLCGYCAAACSQFCIKII